MNLRSETIQQWWPTTQSLDLVEGSVEEVAAVVQKEVAGFIPTETINASWESFADLNSAFLASPDFANVPTTSLVLPTRSKWSVLWNNCFLCDGYDSLCYCITKNHGLTTIHWSAHDEWTSFQSGASFTYRRRVGDEVMERSVCAAQEDNLWDFDEIGEPLPAEDLEGYKAHRIRDRLNEERLAALLARLGASPWTEQFYALPESRVFVLRRLNAPATVIRRSRVDVFEPRRK